MMSEEDRLRAAELRRRIRDIRKDIEAMGGVIPSLFRAVQINPEEEQTIWAAAIAEYMMEKGEGDTSPQGSSADNPEIEFKPLAWYRFKNFKDKVENILDLLLKPVKKL